jgi:hypothetical protein
MFTSFPFNRVQAKPLRAKAESAKAALLAGKWAATRVIFIAYVGFALFTVVGGFVTAPLATWYFFGDWRFWRNFRSGVKLYGQGWRMIRLMLCGESGFMLDVPLTAPPLSAPAPSLVKLNPNWAHGSACSQCSRCCDKIRCPILDPETGFCRGYDAFYWRYFNCGRFPSRQREIDYYGCPKWVMREGFVASPVRKSSPVKVMVPGDWHAGGAGRRAPTKPSNVRHAGSATGTSTHASESRGA